MAVTRKKATLGDKTSKGYISYSEEDMFGCSIVVLLETAPQSRSFRQIMFTKSEVTLLNEFIDKLTRNTERDVDKFFAKRGSKSLYDIMNQELFEYYTPDEIKKKAYKTKEED